ncbi:MAG TPA: cytochrome b/b6 domain-containing protein [Rhodopila sp.]|jgi:cytochrome b|nr:cytochrome b/b6 domain-containing protein [Rhodopila sp.]
MRRIKVWDLPVRLFHWAIVALIFCAWATQEWDHMEWHVWTGYTILTLLLFRILWGLVGSETARFARFLRSPVTALVHLRHITRREADREVGHNAAGGWMVLLMLLLIAVQACTGLFANDDGSTEGPLMHFVSKDRSDWLSHIHALNFTLIEIVVALHVAAVLAYTVLKRQNLLGPMITGSKQLPGDTAAPRLVSPLWALLTLAIAAGVVAWIVRQ